MAISKLILNGVTQMDITDTTATADKILSPYGAYGADGLWMVGAASAGGGLEYESGTLEPEEDVYTPTITFNNVHSTSPMLAMIVDATNTYDDTSDTFHSYVLYDWSKIGATLYANTSGDTRIGEGRYIFRASTGTSFSSGTTTLTNSSSLNGVLTNTFFKPGNTMRTFNAGRTYKWIAVWGPVQNSV